MSVRALLSTAPGGPEILVIGELDAPVAGAGEVLIAVQAAALNFPDVLIIEDKYQVRPPRPFAPGGEVAGTVLAVGTGVTRFAPRDAVVAITAHGGLAEQVVVAEQLVFALPAERDVMDAAALLFTYGTSIHALVDRGEIKPGHTVLVLGAAGGVGLAAVELAKAYGARVVAAVSSEEKAALARAVGADETLIYDRAPFDRDQSRALADRFKAALGPAGADIICDAVGGDYAEPALRAIAWEGRYLVVGFPAGIPRLPLNLILLKGCDVRGVSWRTFIRREPAANAAHVARLFDLWDKGAIRPRVTRRLPLERAAEGIAALSARTATGKIVITL